MGLHPFGELSRALVHQSLGVILIGFFLNCRQGELDVGTCFDPHINEQRRERELVHHRLHGKVSRAVVFSILESGDDPAIDTKFKKAGSGHRFRCSNADRFEFPERSSKFLAESTNILLGKGRVVHRPTGNRTLLVSGRGVAKEAVEDQGHVSILDLLLPTGECLCRPQGGNAQEQPPDDRNDAEPRPREKSTRFPDPTPCHDSQHGPKGIHRRTEWDEGEHGCHDRQGGDRGNSTSSFLRRFTCWIGHSLEVILPRVPI